MGATALYLFGSTVRDETGQGSDLDLFIDYDPKSRNAFDLVGIKFLLEDGLHFPVDRYHARRRELPVTAANRTIGRAHLLNGT
jgi:predicted nucleotidyltransferase